MLQRIYIDNFRCFVNFEVRFERLSMILGKNGSGKSSLFELLRLVQDFVGGRSNVHEVFPKSSRTRWDTRNIQQLEIDVGGNGGVYRYHLEIEHQYDSDRRRVKREALSFDSTVLFLFDQGEVHLYRDDGSAGPVFPADWSRSALAAVPTDRSDNKRLTWLKNWFTALWVVAPLPPVMRSESFGEASELDVRMENFASWYRHMAQEEPGAAARLNEELANVIDGFVELKLPSAGRDTRILSVMLQSGEGAGAFKGVYDFDEISDGQRALIALYALLYLGMSATRTLCIDEADNYTALAEIQPWLMHLTDRLDESEAQVLIISHHPETINYLGADRAKLLERSAAGPVRARTLEIDAASGLSVAETIARGWE